MGKSISTHSFWLLTLIFVATTLSVKSQVNDRILEAVDQLKKQLSLYQTEHPSSNLYLHLDKNICSPEETIWFKAYLLGDTATDNKVIYVRIANEDKEIVLSAQFPMYDIRAHGNIDLPERLAEGKFTLYAYTDRMLSYGDTNVFVQPIRIRKNTGIKLEAQATVNDTTQLVKGGKVQVIVRVREDGRLAKNVKGEYELIAGEKSIKYGRLTANSFGEAFINFTYPKLQDNQSLKVKMLFTKDNDYTELSLNLPHEGNALKVNIRPEGGQLLAGVAGKVAIEVLDIHDDPVSRALLVKDAGKLVAKVSTNRLGIASISLKPETDSKYTVELIAGKMKQIIPFPEVVKLAGYSMKLHTNKDQCTVTVYNKSQTASALLVLRTAREILWSKSISIASGDSINVPVPVASFPKNILSLSVFDQENKPHAERLFMNREEEDYRVRILTDRKDYGMQKKVTVTLQIADAKGNPVVANLSISATEKNRNDSADYRNILQSNYYRSFGQSRRNRFLSVKSVSERDALFRTISWKNNSWSEINSYTPRGSPLRLSNADGAIGMVIKKRSNLKEIYMKSTEVNLSLADLSKNNTLSFKRVAVKLDQNNMFFIPGSSLLSQKGKEWVIDDIYKEVDYLAESNFDVTWKDHDIHFDNIIVKGKILSDVIITNGYFSVRFPAVSPFNFQGENQLAEVNIGGREQTVRKTLKCMDWVCKYNVFNCGGHPTGTRPIKGKVYITNPVNGFQNLITYMGCGYYRNINYIKNITVPTEFPLPDYDSIPQPNEDTRSTIYWNPNIVTDENGTATLSFFTSDIQGEFEIVAQGLEVNTFKPLMGTSSFKVKVNE